MILRVLSGGGLVLGVWAATLAALSPETLSPVRSVAPHVAGRFRDARAFHQADTGQIYVFDPDGDKIRVVRFRGAGAIAPTAMFFAASGRLLVTPGLHEFDPWAAR